MGRGNNTEKSAALLTPSRTTPNASNISIKAAQKQETQNLNEIKLEPTDQIIQMVNQMLANKTPQKEVYDFMKLAQILADNDPQSATSAYEHIMINAPFYQNTQQTHELLETHYYKPTLKTLKNTELPKEEQYFLKNFANTNQKQLQQTKQLKKQQTKTIEKYGENSQETQKINQQIEEFTKTTTSHRQALATLRLNHETKKTTTTNKTKHTKQTRTPRIP